MNKQIKQVVAGLIFHEGLLFAASRKENDVRYGKFEFPGGKVEINETSEQALIREILEELDMEITVGKLFTHVRHEYPTFIIEMDVFFAEAKNDKFNINVHLEAGFFTRNEILKLEFLPADKKIIEEIKTDLLF